MLDNKQYGSDWERITGAEPLPRKDWGYQTITLDLTVARNLINYDMAGDFILFKSISDMQCGLGVRIDHSRADFITALQGDAIRVPTGFKKLVFSNNAGVGQAEILISRNVDFLIRERAVFNTVRNAVASMNVLVGVAPTLIPAVANVLADRVVMTIYNLGPNTVHIGPAGVAVATGYPIPINTSLSIDIEQGINIYGIAAVASNVRILQGS